MTRARTLATALLFSASTALGLSTASAQLTSNQLAGMQMIANGKDDKSLSSFDQVGTANWRIAEQTMAADYGQGYLVTKQSYGDFQLRLEFWAEEGTNSGVFIRCADPEEIGAQSCYEINIFDANPNRNNATGSIVGVMAPLRVPQTELKWNLLEIEARGSQLNVSVNHERTVSRARLQARARPHRAPAQRRRDLFPQRADPRSHPGRHRERSRVRSTAPAKAASASSGRTTRSRRSATRSGRRPTARACRRRSTTSNAKATAIRC